MARVSQKMGNEKSLNNNQAVANKTVPAKLEPAKQCQQSHGTVVTALQQMFLAQFAMAVVT